MSNYLFVNSIPADVLGGGEKWNINIAKALKAEGYTVHLACRPGSKLQDAFSEFTSDIYTLNFGFDFNPASIFKLYRYIKAHKIDVIIGSFTKDISIAGIAGKLAGVSCIVFRNGFPVLQQKWKHKRLLPYFDKIITNSSKIKSLYTAYGWGLEKRIHVIYNGFIQPNQIEEIELERTKPILLGAGRFTSTKRFSVFLDVCAKVNSVRNIKVLLAGEGEEQDALEKRASELGLDIVFLGHQASILPYLNQTDIFLHCSANEGMPNVVMEAMYMGVPVVASNAGATDELVEHEKDGFVCLVDDKQAFVNCVLELLNHPEKADMFSEKGKLKVRTQFLFSHSFKRIKDVFGS